MAKREREDGAADTKRPRVTSPTKYNVLLLEGVHPDGVEVFRSSLDGEFEIEELKTSLSEADLTARIRGVHILGIRSKTKVTAAVLGAADVLQVVGCFCIGTDQTDLEFAQSKGIAVFNTEFGNSRSVAELCMSHIVSLARQLPDRIQEMHKGRWNKVATNCFEIRGKVLGIIGYGHIGAQVSVLGEAFGMRVVYHDILNIMPHGNARQLASLDEVLKIADFVTLHVPETDLTRGMMNKDKLKRMKKGSYLINMSRGTVVDLMALRRCVMKKRLAGCAVDVYPREPPGNGLLAEVKPEPIDIPLVGCPNTILTPHIGGSTEEAQAAIGLEVARKLIGFVTSGTDMGLVNGPLAR